MGAPSINLQGLPGFPRGTGYRRITFAVETQRRGDDTQFADTLFMDGHYPPLLTLGETWTEGQGRWMSCSALYDGTFRVQPAFGALNQCGLLANALRRSIYCFRANRLVPGSLGAWGSLRSMRTIRIGTYATRHARRVCQVGAIPHSCHHAPGQPNLTFALRGHPFG